MGLLMVSVILSGCITGSDTSTDRKETVSIQEEDDDFLAHMEMYQQRRLFRDGYAVPDRSAYGVSTGIFSLLPSVPSDFLYKVYLLKYGRFVDIADLGPEYYTQPEFDPDFTRYGLRYWKEWKGENYKKTHWGTVGYRSYPYSQNVKASPGDSFNVTLIFSSDWNVETYQGVGILPVFISSAISDEGNVIYADPDAENYINVNVTPSEFLLTPAFPQFTPDWSKKLTFTGKIDEGTPPGLYILSMRIVDPTRENSDKWLLEYLNLYSEGTGVIVTDKPFLQAFINVG